MKICVNGKDIETEASTMESLLAELHLLPSQVAVEYNQTVLFRHELSKTFLKENDRIEIIRVVAGG